MLSIDSAHPQKVDGMHRNRWTTYSGFSGRLAPESVVAIDRITQLILRDDYKGTPEYKRIYQKNSFVDWDIPIKTLESWEILLPDVVENITDSRK